MMPLVAYTPTTLGASKTWHHRGPTSWLPSARAQATAWLTAAFWTSNFVISTIANALSKGELFFKITTMRLALVLLGICLCYGFYMLLQKLPLEGFKRRAMAAAMLAPIAAEIYAWAVFFGSASVDPSISVGSWSQAINVVAYWTWFFLAWAALTLALDYSFEMREEQDRSAELQALAHAAKLQALQNQVNPHFLFNSLNSMSALLMDHRVAATDRMIGKLAAFLRMTLAADPLRDSSLAEELKLQTTYLEIEQIRYPDMAIRVDLPAPLRSACLPSLILQPIVENAVKHGVGRSNPPASVLIRAEATRGRLRIAVNNKSSSRTGSVTYAGMGVGLRNVRERLAQRFGEDATLSAVAVTPTHFSVVVEVPLVMP